jgi:hypothetical protein
MTRGKKFGGVNRLYLAAVAIAIFETFHSFQFRAVSNIKMQY